MKPLVVMKFGGTSVGSAERMQDVARIVASSAKDYRVVVVVSAMSGVTDLLVGAADQAAARSKRAYQNSVRTIAEKHLAAIEQLTLTADEIASLSKHIQVELDELLSWLDGVYALSELTPRARDLITSFGERLSIHLVVAALHGQGLRAEAVTADRCIVTDANFNNAEPDLKASTKKCHDVLGSLVDEGVVPVVTGFMGATPKRLITTLGRGGSDYSATILGYCLDADEVWIWTDVTGVMTADPRLIPHARTVDTLSYNEAAELSYFGAKVLHPLTMVPAALKDTPIVIKNTMDPKATGTTITKHVHPDKHGVKAITSMKQLSLITVQGKGMTGVPGVAAKVFNTIAAANISVLFISQASSEYNISLVIKHSDGKDAVRALRKAFAAEVSRHSVDVVRLREHLALIAVVGEDMHGRAGVAGRTFSSLGNANVNIVAIAQGSSERNISLVVNESDIPEAVTAIHQEFNLERNGS